MSNSTELTLIFATVHLMLSVIKFEDLQKQMSTSTKVLQTSHADIDQLRRDLHRWEIELESEYTKVRVKDSVHTQCENYYHFCNFMRAIV